MSPFRFLILAALCYLLYRVLFGPKKPRQKQRQREHQIYQDALVEDPVCHTYIPQKQAVTLKQHGHIHYFCSSRCRDAFLANRDTTKGDG